MQSVGCPQWMWRYYFAVVVQVEHLGSCSRLLWLSKNSRVQAILGTINITMQFSYNVTSNPVFPGSSIWRECYATAWNLMHQMTVICMHTLSGNKPPGHVFLWWRGSAPQPQRSLQTKQSVARGRVVLLTHKSHKLHNTILLLAIVHHPV